MTKPIEIDALALVLMRSVAHRKLRVEVKRLRSLVGGEAHELIGESPAIAEVRARIARMAVTDSTVFITARAAPARKWRRARCIA